MRIELLWSQGTREKIWRKHHITIEEVEDAFYGSYIRINKSRSGTQRILGRTEAGRYLAIFVKPEGSRVAWLLTARDMTSTERDYYES